MSEAPVRGDNEPVFFHPYTKDVNPRLVQPTYQRYIAGEPRFFNREQKAQAIARQDFICPICGGGIDMHHSECHHMASFGAQFGSTSIDNLIVIHTKCHPLADARSLANNDLIVGGNIYNAEPSMIRDIKSFEKRFGKLHDPTTQGHTDFSVGESQQPSLDPIRT